MQRVLLNVTFDYSKKTPLRQLVKRPFCKRSNFLKFEEKIKFVTLHGKTLNKMIACTRHSPNTFARYLSNTLSMGICNKKQKKCSSMFVPLVNGLSTVHT